MDGVMFSIFLINLILMFKDQKHANQVTKKLQKCTTIKEIFDTIEKEFSISDTELDDNTKGFVIHKAVSIVQGVGTMLNSEEEEIEEDDDDQDDDDGDDQ